MFTRHLSTYLAAASIATGVGLAAAQATHATSVFGEFTYDSVAAQIDGSTRGARAADDAVTTTLPYEWTSDSVAARIDRAAGPTRDGSEAEPALVTARTPGSGPARSVRQRIDEQQGKRAD